MENGENFIINDGFTKSAKLNCRRLQDGDSSTSSRSSPVSTDELLIQKLFSPVSNKRQFADFNSAEALDDKLSDCMNGTSFERLAEECDIADEDIPKLKKVKVLLANAFVADGDGISLLLFLKNF